MRSLSTWICIALVSFLLHEQASAQSAGKVYWKGTDQPNGRLAIFSFDVETAVVDTLLSADSLGPNGVAVDTLRNQIYWTDNVELRSRIMRATTDGSNVETIVDMGSCGIGGFTDIELDLVSDQIVWAYVGSCLGTDLMRANLDGSDLDTDLLKQPAIIEEPYYIALDPTLGLVYWDVFSINPKGIGRTPYDGTELESVLDGQAAFGLELDPSSQVIYWSVGKLILRANLSDAGIDTLVVSEAHPTDIALDLRNGEIYWLETGPGLIRRANLDGTEVTTLVEGAYAAERLSLDFGGKVLVAAEPSPAVPLYAIQVHNYPNPFAGSTTLEFTLPEASDVEIDVYDMLGRHVQRLASGLYPPGTSRVLWEAGPGASGLYVARIAWGSQLTSRTLIVQ